MDKCPSCDFADNSLGSLLRRVDDRGLLITLACDFADRVVDLAPEPTLARPWSQATRLWQKYPSAGVSTRKAAQETAYTATRVNGLLAREVEPAKWSAARAVWAAAATAAPLADTASDAAWTAREAAAAAEDPAAENKWQLSHTRELVCNYPRIPEVGQPGPRGRKSLLAH